ncbi:ef hand family protein [Stylonychia lemnae]|uniref:Ef hand family protein n=1 Tax=Stylonychia lemnae TaxID=5949 RepID=A0A077ZNF2_STYLE|nr:ef hand family protein [Stylonychia lemnae]|eukprot:CDW71443.1 ef hand family protein [Stylonychia lemnae]
MNQSNINKKEQNQDQIDSTDLNEEAIKQYIWIQWLRKRFAHTSKIQYLNRPQELKKQIDIQNVFKKFDEDGSNSLDVNEVHEMFQQNGINIGEETLKKLFSIVDKQNKGALDLDKFQKFVIKLIKILRKQEEEKAQQNKVAFLPFDFSSLLNFLSQKSQRDKLLSQVEQSTFNVEETVQDIQAFNNLFKLKAQADTDDLDLPIQKEVKVRCEMERMQPGTKIDFQKSQTSTINETYNEDESLNKIDVYKDAKLRIQAFQRIYKDQSMFNDSSKHSSPIGKHSERGSQSVKIEKILNNYAKQSMEKELSKTNVIDEFQDEIDESKHLNQNQLASRIDKMMASTQKDQGLQLRSQLNSILEANQNEISKLTSQSQSQRMLPQHRKSSSQDLQRALTQLEQVPNVLMKYENFGADPYNKSNFSNSIQISNNRQFQSNRQFLNFLQHKNKKRISNDQKIFREAKKHFKVPADGFIDFKQNQIDIEKLRVEDQSKNLQSMQNFMFKRRDFAAIKDEKLQSRIIQDQMRINRMGLYGMEFQNPSPSRNLQTLPLKFGKTQRITMKDNLRATSTINYGDEQDNFQKSLKLVDLKQSITDRTKRRHQTNEKNNDEQVLRTYRDIKMQVNNMNSFSNQKAWQTIDQQASQFDYRNNHASLEKLHKFKDTQPFSHVFKRNQEKNSKDQKFERRQFIKEIISKKQNNLMMSQAQSIIRDIEQIVPNVKRPQDLINTQRMSML